MNSNPSNRLFLLKAVGLFMGASFFAYLLCVALHEVGHYLAMVFLGIPENGIILNPFGMNYNLVLWDTSTPCRGAFSAAAGPLFDLLIAVPVSLLLWRRRSPLLLPLLLLGSYALISESVGMIMELDSYAYGDWDLVIAGGIPTVMIGPLAVVFLVAGCIWMLQTLPLTGVNAKDPFWRRLVVFLAGIPLIFLCGVIYQTLFGVDSYIPSFDSWALMENVRKGKIIRTIAATVLTLFVIPLNRPLLPWLDRLSYTPVAAVRWRDVLISIGLGIAMTVSQLLFFNDPNISV